MWAFAGGSGTKHKCCGRERDQIRYISAGVGGRGTESYGSGQDRNIRPAQVSISKHIQQIAVPTCGLILSQHSPRVCAVVHGCLRTLLIMKIASHGQCADRHRSWTAEVYFGLQIVICNASWNCSVWFMAYNALTKHFQNPNGKID